MDDFANCCGLRIPEIRADKSSGVHLDRVLNSTASFAVRTILQKCGKSLRRKGRQIKRKLAEGNRQVSEQRQAARCEVMVWKAMVEWTIVIVHYCNSARPL